MQAAVFFGIVKRISPTCFSSTSFFGLKQAQKACRSLDGILLMAPLHVVRHLSAVLVFAAAAMSQTNSSADSSSGSTRGGMCNSSISNANASGIFTFPVQYPLQNPDRSRAMEQVQETSHVLHGPSPSLVETVRKSTETSGTTLQGKTIATIWPSTTTCALLRLGQHDLGNCSSMFTERCINKIGRAHV